MQTLSVFSIPQKNKTDWDDLSKRFPSLIKVSDAEITFISSVYFAASKVLNYLFASVIFLVGLLVMFSAIVEAFQKGWTSDMTGVFVVFGLLPVFIGLALFKYGLGYCKFHFAESHLAFYNPFIHSIRFFVTPNEIERVHVIEHYRNGMFMGYKVKIKIKAKRSKKLVIELPRKSTEVDLQHFLHAFETLLKQ